ncbi:3D domain-containing protein [Maribellus maritimus]|uniref:3D domain-containing protein n=1 Tax=Maribellus maritimus TaxID=2870838 RepID=UPI001EEA652E|nr:3D domain-containing protein [Maribellus maritimus]MCG6189763.1 3D domain-containing protein [Maribellus maritimus]
MKTKGLKIIVIVIPLLFLVILKCDNHETETIAVIATAYNSLPGQTHPEHSEIAAWGDKLEPGMKGIAVSRDLLEMGLDYKTKVKIEGLPGKYLVLDKMNKRWTKKIDIYMGEDEELAKEWGRQQVNITWKKGD